MAIMENDSGKKKCRLSNAKAKQIDSFQTYRRIMWQYDNSSVWSFRAGVKMVTIEKDPGVNMRWERRERAEKRELYSPLCSRFKEFSRENII
ncbi:hypothetical protein DBV15_05757 [Temnothorax longispinosus]|uniref:Uncharacterized protein n=1 Tax=Temnothorax longispinosus TaxID=300112 RepID=A0A4S2KFP2_9HYME|nr:hypothetical protein DBV15_05757 [Temnothorax longispinosus]